jgi:DNA-binding response OmpR family regulator
MDGLDVLRYLRADIRFCKLPMIVLTASGKEEDRVLALCEGVNAFLTKPTSYWELSDVIDHLLAERAPALQM